MEIWGMSISLTFALSVWAAVLSTVLSFLKIQEYWINRFKIDISLIYRSHPELGNDISIKNLSSKPILLESMEIYSKKGIWPFSKITYLWTPEDSWLNARIESIDTKVYTFSEADYFSWSRKDIYVRLHVAGKRIIDRKI